MNYRLFHVLSPFDNLSFFPSIKTVQRNCNVRILSPFKLVTECNIWNESSHKSFRADFRIWIMTGNIRQKIPFPFLVEKPILTIKIGLLRPAIITGDYVGIRKILHKASSLQIAGIIWPINIAGFLRQWKISWVLFLQFRLDTSKLLRVIFSIKEDASLQAAAGPGF